MKNHLTLLLLFSALLFSCSPKISGSKTVSTDKSMRTKSEFDILLSQITNKELKQRLVEFKNEGIERPLDLTTDNPEKVINAAEYYLGTKHKMGGLTKKGMDCSGLIKVSFAQYGGELPHNSHEQGRYGRIIANRGDLQRGDLVFFINTYNSANLITHSGIYLGDGKFIHASSKKGVSVASVDDPYYWKDKYIFGTRVF